MRWPKRSLTRLEVVDVHHAQPVARAGRVAAFALVELGVQQRQRRHLVEAVVEDLAVEQARERVALAVVEQRLHVAVDAQHAEHEAARLDADAAGASAISMTPTAPVSDITGNSVVMMPLLAGLDDLAGGQALEPRRALDGARQRLEVHPGRVGRGRRRIRQQRGARQPALLALVTHQPIDGHTLGREEVAHGVRQADVEGVAVAQPGQRGKVINDFRHGFLER